MTTRQTVSGVERMSPTGPHSHVQKTAATISAMGVTPVLELYSQGFDQIVAKQFENNEEGDRQQRHRPARRNGQREGDR